MVYQNELETWWAGLPGELQSAFGWAYREVDGWLKAVAGDPDDLARAGAVYASVGPQISNIGQVMTSDASALGAAWTGDGYSAFRSKITELVKSIDAAGTATGQTDQIMQAAAQAAVDGANTIVDLVVTAIEFLLGTLALAAATALFSFGASLAAWFAEATATAAETLAEVLNVVARVAQVLEKVAEVLREIASVLRTIAEIFMDWAKFIKGLTLLPKAWTAEGVGEYVSDRVMKFLITKVDGVVGLPTLPSGITKGAPSVVGDVGDLHDDVTRATSVE